MSAAKLHFLYVELNVENSTVETVKESGAPCETTITYPPTICRDSYVNVGWVPCVKFVRMERWFGAKHETYFCRKNPATFIRPSGSRRTDRQLG